MQSSTFYMARRRIAGSRPIDETSSAALCGNWNRYRMQPFSRELVTTNGRANRVGFDEFFVANGHESTLPWASPKATV